MVAAYWSTAVVGIRVPRGVGIVRPSQGQRGEFPVHGSALHGASDDEVVIAPGVIRASVAVGIQGAAELGGGEGGDCWSISSSCVAVQNADTA